MLKRLCLLSDLIAAELIILVPKRGASVRHHPVSMSMQLIQHLIDDVIEFLALRGVRQHLADVPP